MKPYSLRPQAREDRRNQVRYYSKEAGANVAARLVAALRKALQDLERQPRVGFPSLGHELGLDGMRTWTVDGFPLSLWYFERETYLDVARLIGQRQDASGIEVFE